MSRGSLHDVTELVGALVYCVSYVPVWVGWNMVGKHVYRAFVDIKDRTDREDTQAFVEQGATLESLRQMLAHAYYNRVYEEELKACGRFA